MTELHREKQGAQHPETDSSVEGGVYGALTQILGSPDDLKLRSSMTLFAAAAPENALFQQILDVFYDGKADQETLKRLPG